MGGAILTKRAILLLAAFLAVLLVISFPSHHITRPVLNHYYEKYRSHPVESEPSGWNSKSTADGPARLNDQEVLAYRQRLEANSDRFKHSRTLTFSKIFVLSLTKRIDRRARMVKLADALGLEFTFVDATDKDDGVIAWIGERVVEIRRMKADIIAKATGMLVSEIGGGGVTSPWLLGMETKELEFPSLMKKEYNGRDWVAYLAAMKSFDLVPSPGFDVTAALYDPLEKNSRRQVVPAVIATYYSHTRLMRSIAAQGLESALVLEDDVDLEWDLERAWANIERRLPSDWDISFLGSCWGSETQNPAYFHPALHRSTAPRCLHGYAVSRAGALKILAAVSDPWMAFQAAIDTTIPFLISQKAFNSFSLVPPIIIQLKDGPSDIQGGNGSEWRGVLADSTMERIWEDDGEDFEGGYDENEVVSDPALLYHGIIEPPSTRTLTYLVNVKSTSATQTKKATRTKPRPASSTPPPDERLAHGEKPPQPPRPTKPKSPPKFKVGTGGKVVEVEKEKGLTSSSSEVPTATVSGKDGPKRIGTGARPAADLGA